MVRAACRRGWAAARRCYCSVAKHIRVSIRVTSCSAPGKASITKDPAARKGQLQEDAPGQTGA